MRKQPLTVVKSRLSSHRRFISIQTAKKEGEKSTKVVREFTDNEVIQTMEVIGTDVVCVQKFKRI